ncbi:hypothetical protein E2C01_096213 [Portunus trituberculatus]|uniref:Uncharacterized protein n=1 Tax=Portunus trituberculatus TaxID=210409 RepID=A0A5B7K168_PORTR|nr:hypothetical protein [Portunus trituberculatus]
MELRDEGVAGVWESGPWHCVPGWSIAQSYLVNTHRAHTPSLEHQLYSWFRKAAGKTRQRTREEEPGWGMVEYLTKGGGEKETLMLNRGPESSSQNITGRPSASFTHFTLRHKFE